MQSKNCSTVCRQVFTEVMNKMKIGIHSPRKDQCDTCCFYKTGNITREEYNRHIAKKDEAHQAKQQAKSEAHDKTVAITMDL